MDRWTLTAADVLAERERNGPLIDELERLRGEREAWQLAIFGIAGDGEPIHVAARLDGVRSASVLAERERMDDVALAAQTQAVEAAVLAEREAGAKVVDDIARRADAEAWTRGKLAEEIRAALRARK